QDLLVGLHRGSRGDLAAVELVEGGLLQDLAGDVDGLDPLLAVVLRGQVVEPQRRLGLGVDRLDLDTAPDVRVHRSDVDLVAVRYLDLRAVVTHRDRQEVEHQVRVVDHVVTAHEPTGLEVVGRRGAGAGQQPLQTDLRTVAQHERGVEGHRLLAGVLHVDLEVVLEVLTDTGQILHDRDAERLQVTRVAHAVELEQLRRVDRPTAEDDLTTVDVLRLATAESSDRYADGLLAVEQHLVDVRQALHREVGPVLDRVQVRPRGRPAPTVLDVAVERRETFLLVTVDIAGERVTGLLRGLQERAEQRVLHGTAFQPQRTVVAPPLVTTGTAVLHALEVRQAVGVVPGLHARVGGPALQVHRVTALEDHAVDGARPTEHLATTVVHAAAVHVRLGLGFVTPVVQRVTDEHGQRRRHVDEDVPDPVGTTGLQHEDVDRRVGAEPVG